MIALKPNNTLLPDSFYTASRLQNCRKALRYTQLGEVTEEDEFLNFEASFGKCLSMNMLENG